MKALFQIMLIVCLLIASGCSHIAVLGGYGGESDSGNVSIEYGSIDSERPADPNWLMFSGGMTFIRHAGEPMEFGTYLKFGFEIVPDSGLFADALGGVTFIRESNGYMMPDGRWKDLPDQVNTGCALLPATITKEASRSERACGISRRDVRENDNGLLRAQGKGWMRAGGTMDRNAAAAAAGGDRNGELPWKTDEKIKMIDIDNKLSSRTGTEVPGRTSTVPVRHLISRCTGSGVYSLFHRALAI